MIVSEIFYSLQGEGILAGLPSVFIRLAGCPIRCNWCDTRYAWDWDAGSQMDVQAIESQVKNWHARHVVITGGEPMADQDLSPRQGLAELTLLLKGLGYHVTIETAGIVFVPELACDLMSISPKPGHIQVDVIRSLCQRYQYQLKFVFGPWQVGQIRQILAQIGQIDQDRVMLMPQARTKDELLVGAIDVASACLANGWRFCQRLQVMLWEGQKGR